MPGAIPLHEAIELVLGDAGRPMHADDIAAEINPTWALQPRR